MASTPLWPWRSLADAWSQRFGKPLQGLFAGYPAAAQAHGFEVDALACGVLGPLDNPAKDAAERNGATVSCGWQ
jgi:hypothetical protein